MEKLQMTAQEILRSYRQAADRQGQIRILADLNAVTQEEIREVLRQCGEALPEKKRAGRSKREPVQIEEETRGGAKPEPVTKPEPVAEPQNTTEPEMAAVMGAAALAEILRRVTEGFPETEVRAEGKGITGARLEICWDARGELAGSRLVLLGK